MAFPATDVIDDFNRADENPLSDGGKWLVGPEVFLGFAIALVSNAITDSAGTASNAYRTDKVYGPDAECYATWVSFSATPGAQFYLRIKNVGAGSTDGYYTYPLPFSSAWYVYRLDNNVATLIADFGSVTVAAGDAVGGEIIGATIQGFLKPAAGAWASVGSVTDETYTAAGYIGLGFGADNVFDNFGGGTVGEGSGTELTYFPKPVLKKEGVAPL